jgi:hypothetical protein
VTVQHDLLIQALVDQLRKHIQTVDDRSPKYKDIARATRILAQIDQLEFELSRKRLH